MNKNTPNVIKFQGLKTKKILANFISSFKKAPDELILDFDATDNPVHGNQEKTKVPPYPKELALSK